MTDPTNSVRCSFTPSQYRLLTKAGRHDEGEKALDVWLVESVERLDAITFVLNVPEGVDVVKLILCQMDVVKRAVFDVEGARATDGLKRAVDSLQELYRSPLPTKADLWFLEGGGVARVIEGSGRGDFHVDAIIGNFQAEEQLERVRDINWGAGRLLDVSELSWLTDSDGNAVRVVLPEDDCSDASSRGDDQ